MKHLFCHAVAMAVCSYDAKWTGIGANDDNPAIGQIEIVKNEKRKKRLWIEEKAH